VFRADGRQTTHAVAAQLDGVTVVIEIEKTSVLWFFDDCFVIVVKNIRKISIRVGGQGSICIPKLAILSKE